MGPERVRAWEPYQRFYWIPRIAIARAAEHEAAIMRRRHEQMERERGALPGRTRGRRLG